MNPRILVSVILLLLFVMEGCHRHQTVYHWGDYESALYQHYANPAEVEPLLKSLRAIINRGERKRNVPPGLYAEYGYLLFTMGRLKESIALFAKEKRTWPESTLLMEKLIRESEKRLELIEETPNS
jgi:hypothetical protein